MLFALTYVGVLCQVLIYCIVAWSLISWFPVRSNNPVLVILQHITGPMIKPLRRILPRVGVFDLSPIVAIVILIAIPFILGLFF